MFTQITAYEFTNLTDATAIAGLLGPFEYIPIGTSQEKTVGFVPPRNEIGGALAECQGGQIMMALVIETKSVPASVVRSATDEKVAELEAQTGRKPGKKERKEIAEDVRLALLPSAFPKQTRIPIWLDTKKNLLIIGSTTQSKTDEVASALVNALNLSLAMLHTNQSAKTVMATWLMASTVDDWPQNISVERECTLQSTDESSASVKFSNHHLSTDEIKNHIQQGKLPTSLALSWDGKVSFVLNELLQLKKIKFLDGAMDESGTDKSEDRFDADFALSTGLLSPLMEDLIESMGGRTKQGKEAEHETEQTD